MKRNSLQDQAALLEKINNAISDSIYILDLQARNLLWLNDRGEELYGYSLEEIQDMGDLYHANTMHPDDMPVLLKALEKAKTMRDGEVISLEYRFKDKLGNYHWHNDRITVFSRNESGIPTAILGVASNVNERKVYEETLKNTIQKLNLSLAAAGMGTWEWDIEQNILHWDHRMYEIHGLQKTLQNPMEQIWAHAVREDMEAVNIKVQEAVKRRQDFYVTYRMIYDNREVHHVRCYGKFLDEKSRMYGVAWDSTEEVLTEREIAEAKAKLISSTKMAALGEMSGGIAHEINNPLTVIQARAFQLSQMVENNKLDPEKIKQASESISRTADKIARIIKSLRSFAREGNYDPFEIVPIRRIIEETLEFCRTRFYNHGVEIEVGEIDPELEVECRVIQIEQVLLNLLNNSFDAVQSLEQKWIRIEVQEEDDGIEIHVIDSGKGIPQEIADQIMLPFFTTKEVGKGTGLGLSISEGILKSHQGSLALQREAPNTTFVIRLPKLQEE